MLESAHAQARVHDEVLLLADVGLRLREKLIVPMRQRVSSSERGEGLKLCAAQMDRARINARNGTPASSSSAVLFTKTTARTMVPPSSWTSEIAALIVSPVETTSSTISTFFPCGDA